MAGAEARLIYTAPQEYFFTQIKVALFTAAFLSCPIVFAQIYAFVAPDGAVLVRTLGRVAAGLGCERTAFWGGRAK